MSELVTARCHFTQMLAMFLRAAYVRGYSPALDYVKRCPDCKIGHPRSVHKVGLAGDVLLYDAGGGYITDPQPYRELHKLWDTMGGASIIPGDSNHFSIGWEGMR